MGLVSISERSQRLPGETPCGERTRAPPLPSESLRPLSGASMGPDAEPGLPELRAKTRQHLVKMFETWRKMAGCKTGKENPQLKHE